MITEELAWIEKIEKKNQEKVNIEEKNQTKVDWREGIARRVVFIGKGVREQRNEEKKVLKSSRQNLRRQWMAVVGMQCLYEIFAFFGLQAVNVNSLTAIGVYS